MTIVMPRITTTAMTTMTTISTTATTTATTMSGRKKFLETELSSSTEFKFRNEELRWLLQGREQKEREGKNKSQKCDAFSISVSVNALE